MKKLILLLIVILPLNLLAQKMVIIPDGQQKPFQKVLITWYDGIDAVQLKDKTWCISESDYKRLPANITKEVEVSKDNFVIYNVKDELSKLPVKTLVPTNYKVAEAMEIEKIIPK